MKIAIDVMGTDKGIEPIIKAIKTFTKTNDDVKYVLVGNESEIKIIADKVKLRSDKYQIFNTSEFIEPGEGIMSFRRKKDSSLTQGLNLLKNDEVSAFISGGSTPAFLAGCQIMIGSINDMRPAFMPFIPTVKKGKYVNMLDVGASVENTAKDLHNFALMAKIYVEKVLDLENPRIGLLNIGEESTKGLDFHKEAYKVLEQDKSLNFVGNIESRDIVINSSDIIVCDGYSGNLALKAIEGMAQNLMMVLKKELKKNLWRKLKALSLRKAFKGVKETFDYRNNASAIVLGLNKIAIKTHGSSDEISWLSALRLSKKAVEQDVSNRIKDGLTNE